MNSEPNGEKKAPAPGSASHAQDPMLAPSGESTSHDKSLPASGANKPVIKKSPKADTDGSSATIAITVTVIVVIILAILAIYAYQKS